MSVPKSVEDQAKTADDLQKAVIEDAATPDPGTDPDKPVVGKEDTLETPVVNNPDPPDFEQKYKSLMGRVESQAQELASAKANNDLLYKQVSDANRKALDLETKLKEAEAKLTEVPENDSQENSDLIDVESITKYGPEFTDMAKKLNAVISGAKPSEPEPEPDPVKMDLPMFRQQIIADTWVANNLDYALMDNSDLFKGWLRSFDSVTGIKRSDEWFEVIGVRDKEGCLRVINTFLSSPEGAQYKTSLLTPEPSPDIPNAQPDIQTPTTLDEPANPAATGKIWTSKLVNAFYADQSRGKYKGKEEEVKAIEADIFAAQNDGRWQG